MQNKTYSMKLSILKSTTISLIILLFLSSFSLPGAKDKAQKYIDRELKTDSLFNNAIVGICAINEQGEKIAQWNSNLPMLTASTLKTITTGVGLHYLGSDFKFTTRISYSGTIKDSILNGNIHIIGGADPTLGSEDTVAFKVDSIFGIWAKGIKLCGIKQVNGNIVADDSYFKREMLPDTWSWGNLGPYYGSAASGLSFFENAQKFILKPGKNIGDSAKVEAIYPYVPGLKIINKVTTGAAKTADKSAYYAQDLSLCSKYIGTIPIDKAYIKSDNSNKFPHLSCAWHFKKYLEEKAKISVSGSIEDIENIKFGTILFNICQTYSPELWKIVNVTNRISNNFFAETILKTIGKQMTKVGSIDSSLVAVKKILIDMGVNVWGLEMADGSGLSRQNYVSPEFFCNYYTKMKESANFAKFFESLPIPGNGGTLKNVLKNASKEDKEKIHAKSGSLSGVKCYAGYVQSKSNGLVKFAILVNNYTAPTSKLQTKIEQFMLELTK